MSIITFTLGGTVAPVSQSSNGTYGIDYGGYFGPPGATIAGLPFTIKWTGEPCNCAAWTSGFNPIVDATITIAGVTFDFGSGSANSGIFYDDFLQVDSPQFSLSTNLGGDSRGVFYINLSSPHTQAFLNTASNSMNVPGPVAGEGLVSLCILLCALCIFRLTRRTNCA